MDADSFEQNCQSNAIRAAASPSSKSIIYELKAVFVFARCRTEAINLVDNHHNMAEFGFDSSSGRIEGVQDAIHGFYTRRARARIIIISEHYCSARVCM
jgi:hypothetical protein